MTESLASAYPAALARARALLVEYRALPDGAGTFGALMIDDAIRRADIAVAAQDVVAMIRSYEELQALK